VAGGQAVRQTKSDHLLRVLGLAFGIAVVVGGTIGQGILRAPGLVAQGAPDSVVILALWIVGGTIALIDAMSTVELAASIPRAGGPYSFARRAFGPFVGLATGMTDWLGNIGGIAYVSVVFGEYLHRAGLVTAIPLGLLAAALPLAVAAIQWFGTRVAGRSQQIGTAVKALVFSTLIVALLFSPRGDAMTWPAVAPGLTVAGVILAVRAIVGTYYGWNGVAYFSEEVRDSGRTIARATFSGIAVITGIYVLMNVEFLTVLTPLEMANSSLVAADAAVRAIGPAADAVITAISLISLVTIANSLVMFPRVLYAIARDAGDLPGLSSVAANGTPRIALLVTAGGGALLATVGGLRYAAGIQRIPSCRHERMREPGRHRDEIA
jgi:APA family basic amino acid/polyamine antiporter